MTYMIVLVLVVLVSAIATKEVAAEREYPDKCLHSLDDFQVSLLNRSVNLISLQNAFYPANRQSSISFTVKYYLCNNNNSSEGSSLSCRDVERWVSDLNSGRVPSVDYAANFSYKFGWNASPVSLFIRPELLAALSLFTFRIEVPTVHIILDPICPDAITPDLLFGTSIDYFEICNNPTPPVELLNQLTQDLKSFYLHKGSFLTHGTKVGNEQGYSTFSFYPEDHVTDFCVLHYTEDYRIKRNILAVAVIITQVFNLLVIPFTARRFYKPISDTLSDESSDLKHYFRGFTLTIGLLGVAAFICDIILISSEEANDVLKSVISDVHAYYIGGLVFLLLFSLFLNFLYTVFLNAVCLPSQEPVANNGDDTKTKKKWFEYCTMCCSWFGFFVFIYVFVTELFSFHGIYILMGLVAAPVVTGSLVIFYITAVFLSTMFFALISKGIAYGKNNGVTANTKRENALLIFDVFLVIFIGLLFLAGICLYLTFYYRMVISVEPYSTGAGFLSSFGTLVPSILTLTAGLLEKRLIKFLSGSGKPQSGERSPLKTGTSTYGSVNGDPSSH